MTPRDRKVGGHGPPLPPLLSRKVVLRNETQVYYKTHIFSSLDPKSGGGYILWPQGQKSRGPWSSASSTVVTESCVKVDVAVSVKWRQIYKYIFSLYV